jgi:hypothetical protein
LDNEANIQVLSLINEIILNEKENKNLYNLLVGLGNLTYSNFKTRSLAIDMDIPANVKALTFVIDEQSPLLNEIRQYLLNIIK